MAVAALVALACGRSGEIEVQSGINVNTNIVDAGANVGFYADLELDTNARPTIAYYDLTNGDLKFARLNAVGDWDTTVVDEEGDVGGFADLEYGSNGFPHITYYDFTNGGIKYAIHDGLRWQIQRVPVADEIAGYTSFELTRNDVAHIGAVSISPAYNLEWMQYDPFSQTLGGEQPRQACREAAQAAAAEGEPVPKGEECPSLLSSRSDNINLQVSMELRRVGNQEFPVMTYYEGAYGRLAMSWQEVQEDGGVGFSHRVLDGEVKIGSHNVGQWSSSFIDVGDQQEDPTNEDLDDDVLHISYYDAGNKDLMYGRYQWSRDEFIRERVDRNGIVGETSNIIIDGQGRPNITYFDSTNNDLKLAVRVEQGRWISHRVDLRGVVGSFSSVRVLRDGSLGIAYRNTGRQALVFSVVRTN